MKGIRDAQDILFAEVRRPERAEEIRMDTLVGCRALRKGMKNIRPRTIVLARKLTALTGEKMGGNVSIHAGPVVRLEDTLPGFGHPAVTREEPAMGFLDDGWDQGLRQEKNRPRRVVSTKNAAPNDAVFREASGTHLTNDPSHDGVRGKIGGIQENLKSHAEGVRTLFLTKIIIKDRNFR